MAMAKSVAMATAELETIKTMWRGQSLTQPTALIGQLDARARVIAGFVLAFATAVSQQLAVLNVFLLVAVGFVLLARISLKHVLKRLIALESFMILLLILLPFTTPGTVLFSVFGLSASSEGLLHAVQIMVKANAVVLFLIALLGTMNANTLGHALVYLQVPKKLIYILLFMIRYIDVIGKEYARIKRAMKARAYVMRFNRHTWRSTGYLVGMLLIHSLERSERIMDAMKCRGFNGNFYLFDSFRWQRKDTLFVSLIVGLTTVVLLGGWFV